MRTRLLALAFFIILLSSSFLPIIADSPSLEISMDLSEPGVTEAPESKAAGILTDSFVQNIGQLDNPDMQFYSAMGNIAFTNNSVLIYSSEMDRKESGKPVRLSTVSFTFIGANNVMPDGLDCTQWASNYFLGNDSMKWYSGVPNFMGVVYKNLWNNIDLEYRMVDGHLKYQFILHPDSNPSSIAIMVDGQEGLSISKQEISIKTGIGASIVDSGLDVFYADDVNSKVEASFMLRDEDTYSFELGFRDPNRTLIIDPLIYSTYMGGAGSDSGNSISVDENGCAYLTGQTNSLDFIMEPGIIELENRPSADMFVAKLDSRGNSLLFSTFIGGTEYDEGKGIAIDSQGYIHVTGVTYSENFPSTNGAFDKTYNGVGDAFVIKLAQDGDSMVYSTYLGGVHDDMARSIAVDSQDQAYVTGETWSASFPVTDGAMNMTLNGDSDIFVAKLSLSGDSLNYSTFLGGTGSEQGNDISIDEEGCAYVAGMTKSVNFAGITNSVTPAKENAFVAKLDKYGNSLEYSMLLGGSGNDFANSIALDQNGRAYVTGGTDSRNFPTTAGTYDENFNGQTDAFMAKLSQSGDSVIYSTYLGGSMDDEGTGISVDADGTAYITGHTKSTTFPSTVDAFNRTLNGDQDCFVAWLSNTGSKLLYSTFLGGEDLDLSLDIALSNNRCVYVTGSTLSEEFPVTNQTYSMLSNGARDGFVTKMDFIVPVADAGPDIYLNESNVAIFNGTGSYDNVEIISYVWTMSYGELELSFNGSSPVYFFEKIGTYRVRLKVIDKAGNTDTDTMYLRVLAYPYPVARAGPDRQINQSTELTFNGSTSWDSKGIESYRWSFNDGINNICLIDQSPSWTFTVPGTYEVALNVTDANLNYDIDYMNVTVIDGITPITRVQANISIMQGELARFNGSASTDNVGIMNYTWRFTHNDTNITLYGESQSFKFWTPENYIVTLNVTDEMGNTDSDIIAVMVFEPEVIPETDMSIYLGGFLLILSIIFLIWVIFHCLKSKPPTNENLEVEND